MAGNALRTGICLVAGGYIISVIFIFAREGGLSSPLPLNSDSTSFSSSPFDGEIPGEGIWIAIPSLGIRTEVTAVGLTPKGNIGIPEGYDTTAWFTGSAKPGVTGTSIIVGHRDTRIFAPGVFRSLGKLAAGDDVYVYRGGVSFHFKVRRAEVYPEDTDQMDEIMAGDTHTARLNLITCEGIWNQAVRRYDKRLVVFTELVTE